ncbi:RNA-guided endonuclease IscB [Nonomuraea sp. NPDC049129]|uniref:RNA-guided endonuclease IscB n=1 Tax=Nonomuraea sp. NPDC049129 TaxID=3155272 RepID=UPI0033F6ADA2
MLDRHGKPLQPCRPGRARQFLKAGRAVVVRHTPFVIRLTDRALADSTVAGVEIGLDPGSKHTGIAVFTERGASRAGKYSVQLDHRGAAIRDKLTARSRYRRGRRSRNLRYRAPRFLNRAKPKGWLAPSLRHRVDTTMSWVARLGRWAPVRAIQIERVAFDTHAMSAGKPLEGVEYQQGTLAGYEVRQYLLEKWGRTCAYCGAAGTRLQVEHIHPKARGGSDRISNLTLACQPCNQAKNTTPVEEFLRNTPTAEPAPTGTDSPACGSPASSTSMGSPPATSYAPPSPTANTPESTPDASSKEPTATATPRARRPPLNGEPQGTLRPSRAFPLPLPFPPRHERRGIHGWF